MRRAFRPADDSGMAMVLVVGAMMTLMLLVLGGLAYAMQSEKFSKYDQDYTAAMAAAQSGIEDYISRLNRNDAYHASVDCANVALKGRTTVPNSCGWNASTPAGWAPVTAGAGASSPHFHYTTDVRNVSTQGTILVTSTGRSGDVYRTIEVAVGKGGSTDYVYYTDFESADPDNEISYPTGAPNDGCGRSGNSAARYFWQGRSSCSEITFISSDTLNGRVFSNDAILSGNASFEQGIESANTGCLDVTGATSNSTWNKCLRSGSTARFGKQPKYSSPLYLEDTAAKFATYPGCHYHGATRVIFNNNGTMRVWSKDSDFVGGVFAVAGPDGFVPTCGERTALASPGGATVPVPNDMVIYVAKSPTAPARQLFGDEIGGPDAREGLPLGDYSASDQTPTPGASYTADLNMNKASRFRGEGNLYVQGTLKGRVTIAAAQSVIVTGDVVLAGGKSGTDMLGLVASNSVEVMHPRMVTMTYARDCVRSGWFGCSTWGPYEWKASGEDEAGSGPYSGEVTWPRRVPDPVTGGPNPASGVQIAGSIQTLQHSFFVQRYNVGGPKGTLLVSGSIAQRWRGAVGTGSGSASTGYSKLYQYDERLQYSAPPYFPAWANSAWSARYSGEITTPTEAKTG